MVRVQGQGEETTCQLSLVGNCRETGFFEKEVGKLEKTNRSNHGFKGISMKLVLILGMNIVTTIAAYLIQYIGFSEVNIVVIYILSVLVTSYYAKDYAYGIIASVLAMLSFNFFFTTPLYTFKVDDPTYIFTFMVMLLSSVFTSALTSSLIQNRELAGDREEKAHILYQIASSLAKTSEVQNVAVVSVKYLANLFECPVSCILNDVEEKRARKVTAGKREEGTIIEDLERQDIPGELAKAESFPIQVHDATIGYILLPPGFREMNENSRLLLDSIIMQITFAMERERLASEKKSVSAEVERERFKSNLLRAISHDLRTPLTRITGASEMLQHILKEDKSLGLAQGIYEDSSWLTRLVENILNLTKIQEGKLSIDIRTEAVEEILAEAIHRSSKYYPAYKVQTEIPDEVVFLPMDGRLIVQVLINLIMNSIEHTTPAHEIRVTVRVEREKVWFEVYNNGSSIDEADLPGIFEMFHVTTSSRTDSKQGIGLGLAICRTIVNLHQGEIFAENNPEGGTTFKFYLPSKEAV